MKELGLSSVMVTVTVTDAAMDMGRLVAQCTPEIGNQAAADVSRPSSRLPVGLDNGRQGLGGEGNQGSDA